MPFLKCGKQSLSECVTYSIDGLPKTDGKNGRNMSKLCVYLRMESSFPVRMLTKDVICRVLGKTCQSPFLMAVHRSWKKFITDHHDQP